MLKSQIPVPQNVSVIRDKSFKDVIKSKQERQGGSQSNMAGVPTTRGGDTRGSIHRGKTRSDRARGWPPKNQEERPRRNQLC